MAKQEALHRLEEMRQCVENVLSDLDYHIQRTKTIIQPETSEEYCAHGGTRCPYCGSDALEGGSVQIDAATAWQPITCVECGKKWNDIYTIAAYEPVT